MTIKQPAVKQQQKRGLHLPKTEEDFGRKNEETTLSKTHRKRERERECEWNREEE